MLSLTLGWANSAQQSLGADDPSTRYFIASTNWTPKVVDNPLHCFQTGCVVRVEVVRRDQTVQTVTSQVAIARLEDAVRLLRFRDDLVSFRSGYISTQRFWDAHHGLVAHTGVKTPSGEIHLLDAESNIVGVAYSIEFADMVVSNTLKAASALQVGNHPR